MAVASARRLLAACPHSIAVVRADDTALAELLTQEGLQCVVAERAGEGMGYSLAAGVAATMDAVASNAAKAVSGAPGADKNARDNATDDAAGNAANPAANPAAGGWLVALADMPFIAPESYAAVLAALADGARIARPLFGGRPGHPVGFAAEYCDALLVLTGDEGGKAIIAGDPTALRGCPVDDPGVLHDIDRPAR
jgi:molybdenum cofactor cytidylyltransferase